MGSRRGHQPGERGTTMSARAGALGAAAIASAIHTITNCDSCTISSSANRAKSSQGSASEGALLHANSKPANYSEYFQDKELLAQLMQHSLREERWFGYSAVEVASSPAVAQAAAELQRHRWSTGDWSRHTPPSPLPPVHDDPPADKGRCVGSRPLHPGSVPSSGGARV